MFSLTKKSLIKLLKKFSRKFDVMPGRIMFSLDGLVFYSNELENFFQKKIAIVMPKLSLTNLKIVIYGFQFFFSTEVSTFVQCLVTWEIERTCLVVSSLSLVSFICVK